MDESLRQRLTEYVHARNARRSDEAAAAGFVSGQRIHSLKMSKAKEAELLAALSDWVEEMARKELGMPPRAR